MSLDIYRETSPGVYAKFREYGATGTLLPITTTHDGTLGEVVETNLFVRSDNVYEYYTNIVILPASKTSPSEVDGISTGHGVKLSVGETQPTEAEWDAMDYSSSISISNIGSVLGGDVSSSRSFWYRQECPAGAPADNPENVVLRLSWKANAV